MRARPFILLLVWSAVLQSAVSRPVPDQDYVRTLTSSYLSNEDLLAYINDYTQRCSKIAKQTRFGFSAGGQPLIAIEISDNPGVDTGKPQVKYVANIHGDEPSGRQLTMLLAEQLCAEYQQAGSPAQQLVSMIRLYLIPTLNPDGFAAHTRENKNQVDLNRNFPDPIRDVNHDLREPVGREQPEVLAMMNFTLSNRFIASLAFHEGALVANYPFDGYADGSREVKHEKHMTMDDATFVMLSTTYANLHTTMHDSTEFKGGITNGAQWYPLYGGMQDWNYLAAGCMEVTLELNNDKWPDPVRLAQMWTENSQALVTWPLKAVMGGLHGTVMSIGENKKLAPIQAVVHVQGQGVSPTSDIRYGNYYRPLAPGTYTVTYEAEGHIPHNATVTIPKDGSGLQQDVQLIPISLAAMAKRNTDGTVIIVPDTEAMQGEKDVWIDVERPVGTLRAGPDTSGALLLAFGVGAAVVTAAAYYAWRRNTGMRTALYGEQHMLPLHAFPRPIAVRQRI